MVFMGMGVGCRRMILLTFCYFVWCKIDVGQ